ncbi:MAG: hypothetical protein PWQ10_623, partial [Patescibacteria group bacterium]|nr:hypothetical protein [Patescibacteria group bacterium]
QTNNSIIEKYCYNNDEANCTTYGALYQWNEAMQYTNTEGSQGICPTGSHIPSDNDWKVLEMQLGMTQAQADATGWRGTDQGTQMKVGGNSGLNILFAGSRSTGTTFNYIGIDDAVWTSSTASSTESYVRYFGSTTATIYRNPYNGANGFSVRCLKN